MKARIQNNIAVDAHEAPEKAFHPTIAEQFEAVPNYVKVGWIRDADRRWVAPDEPIPTDETSSAVRRTNVTRTEYYGLFTPTEEALIRIAAEEAVTADVLQAADEAEKQRLLGVASLAVMLKRTDSLAPSDTIDLANPQTQAGLGLLVAMNLLTQARKEEIELGI